MQYNLKELRARKCLTQKQMAEKLGISVTSLSWWENNPSMIKIGNMKKIADIYEVKLDEIKID